MLNAVECLLFTQSNPNQQSNNPIWPTFSCVLRSSSSSSCAHLLYSLCSYLYVCGWANHYSENLNVHIYYTESRQSTLAVDSRQLLLCLCYPSCFLHDSSKNVHLYTQIQNPKSNIQYHPASSFSSFSSLIRIQIHIHILVIFIRYKNKIENTWKIFLSRKKRKCIPNTECFWWLSLNDGKW